MGRQSKISFNLKGLENLTSQMKGYKARVGILGDKAQRNDADATGDLNNAEIGLVQITGSITNKIPPRDFLLFPVEHKRKEIMQQMAGTKVKAAIDRGDVKTIFKLLGAAAEAVIQDAFYSGGFGQWAPNAPSTIDRKGSASPLIHTSQLRRSVTSEVVKKGVVQ